MKRYIVVKDLQGGEFGMGRCYTAEEWLEQMLEWRDSDDSWGDYGDGDNEYLDTRDGCKQFWESIINEGKEQKLIDYIADIWQLEFDTKENVVAELQDQVSKNNIPKLQDLEKECERYGLEAYEDILSPMEWNACDKCGDLWETDRLLWTEGFEWNKNDKTEMAIAQYIEDRWDFGEYLSALCPSCVSELREKLSQKSA